MGGLELILQWVTSNKFSEGYFSARIFNVLTYLSLKSSTDSPHCGN